MSCYRPAKSYISPDCYSIIDGDYDNDYWTVFVLDDKSTIEGYDFYSVVYDECYDKGDDFDYY